MSKNIQPHVILDQLKQKGMFPSEHVISEQMSGSTDGKVYMISSKTEPKYVLKVESPTYTQQVHQFLETYEGTLYPKVRYTDPNFNFIIYDYIHGTANDNKGVKAEWLSLLAEKVINQYQPIESDGWGWLDESLADSWRVFLQQEINEARERIGDLLPAYDHDTVQKILDNHLPQFDHTEQYLLHGDCGVHNFVFDSNVLQGIIDPIPMAGPRLYDFIFAFCSSPDHLTMETLLTASKSLHASICDPDDHHTLIKAVIIQLYLRLATCLAHHSTQFPEYIAAWHEWTCRYKEVSR